MGNKDQNKTATEPKAQEGEVVTNPPAEEKAYSQKDVDAMLTAKELSIRKEALNTVVEKNTELKSELLAKGSDEYFDISKWEVMRKMSEDMVKSGAFPSSDNAHTLIVKMQAGRESGMKPMESIKSFYVVKGVLTIFGAAVTRRLREHGWRIQYDDKPNSCTATITKGEETYSDTLTFEEAQKSKWTENWDKDSKKYVLKPGWYEGANRKLKLRYGAASMLIKTYVPEVLGSAVDIAEVAMDTVQVIQGTNNAPAQIEGANEPASSSQIASIKNLGGVLPDGEEITKQQAADMIKELMEKKRRAPKKDGAVGLVGAVTHVDGAVGEKGASQNDTVKEEQS